MRERNVAGTAGSRRRPRWVWVPLVAAAAFTCWSAWSYGQVDRDSLDYARTRDEVLSDGRRHIAELNSMDATRIDAGLRRWLDASTGLLHDELRRTQAQSRQQLQRARTTAQGSVTDAALTALDTRAGTAQLIAAVQVTLTTGAGAPATERRRYEAGLVHTAGGWKLRSLTAIPADAR